MNWHDFIYGTIGGSISTLLIVNHAPWWGFALFGGVILLYDLVIRHIWWR